VLAAASIAATGCDKIRDAVPSMPSAAMVPGGQHTRQRAKVIPTRKAPKRLTLEVEHEVGLTNIARALGTSVDEIIAVNQLSTSEIKRGQVLLVQSTPDLLARYVAYRENRKARIAARKKEAAAKRAAPKPRRRVKTRPASKKKRRLRKATRKTVRKRASRTRGRSR